MEMPESAVSPYRPRLSSIKVADPRWSLGFAGVFFFIFVQYTSLPEMYPVLAPLHTAKMAIALAGLGYLIAPRVRVEGYSGKWVDSFVLVFVVASFFSALLAMGKPHPMTGFFDVLRWAVVYFLLSRILASRWRLKVLLGLFLLLNFKLAQFAIHGYGQARLAGYSNMQFISLGGAIGGTNAFFGNAGDLGVAMCVAWGITWALLFRKGSGVFERMALGVCFIGFFLTILIGGTRGAVLAAAAIVLTALVRSPKRIAGAFLLVVFLLSLFFLLPGASKERFSAALNWRHDPDTFSRLMFWQGGLDMWERNPIFGVGPDGFPAEWAQHYTYLAPSWRGQRSPHSLYIQVLSEHGLAGALTFLVLVFAFLQLNAKTRKMALESSAEGRRSFEYCVAAGLAALLSAFLDSSGIERGGKYRL
jgi:O-antigen ligase